ncbi:hypothetical protein KQ247_16920 [Ruegeria pomeroyi]|uniref:Uncharacterized protein n=2 Tax=Ruegeria pomeroyi TaxID=89184 RepID=Q5LSZ5_RUEPO|nr:hypothetical protein [Ruegeria pomeroyi]AAV94906.1 hypothetical protein SPO1619 [Ruegeria pomeroyi DSS-3]NVK96245.1 hypothetical protein [Ruegeria pomeroyi]NVL00857.1 hypothetical protein [Ruegeria pomeroyi]QWV08478.1 hypothetical protein KQ247_16920 [Ruegeria pomeroyi]
MVMEIHRERAAILGTKRNEDDARVFARVRLRFSLAGQQSAETSAIVVSVAVTAERNQPWRRTRRQILASAWHWLERYFDGASLEAGDRNLFSDVFEEQPWQKGSSLSPTQERGLQRDLRRIAREHAV